MKNLLIVDDNRGIRLLLKEVFNKEGYQVHLATSGAEAFQITENISVDCVLLDFKIPDMSGTDIAKGIKERNENTLIIMMSAFSDQDLLQEVSKVGVKRLFAKPFNIQEIKDVVKKLLN